MSSESRQFEELVSRIEGSLVPTGAVIKSPDHVTDKITGEVREIDVSIRYKIGSVEILIEDDKTTAWFTEAGLSDVTA